MKNITDSFIRSIFSFEPNQIATTTYSFARACFLDYLACSLAGSQNYGNKLNDYILGITESGQNSVIGKANVKVSAQNAALLNGISAHVIELDDGHRIGMLHLAAPILSALLSVAEKELLNSKDFLFGIIIGYEVAIRLACAVQPGCKLKGYHATGTCGTVGAAMGIASALHFDFDQMKSAFSAATTSAAGLLEMIEGDTEMKPFNAGRAAMDGVAAAYIGRARFKSPEDALGGKRGFLNIMTDVPKVDYLTDFNLDKMMIEGIYMKPYAACRHCHPSIEAALHIREQKGFNIEDIENIEVETYKLAVGGHDHTIINGMNSAKMSIPYSLSVALRTGKAGLGEFDESHITDESILAITEKVSVVAIDELTSLCPQKRVAIVNVITKSGVYSDRVDYPKGEPENPLTKEELERKFRELAIYGGLTVEECDEVIEEVWKDVFELNKIIDIVSLSSNNRNS